MCGQTAGPCKNTQVPNSNYAKTGSLRGVGGDERKVVCKGGFSGSGISTCVSGKFTAINCKPLPCKNTQFANSNYKKLGKVSLFCGYILITIIHKLQGPTFVEIVISAFIRKIITEVA